RAGTHLALFHGSERSTLRDQGDGKIPHAPFASDDVRHAGIDHAFVGHYHVARLAAHHTYPGNPDPPAFGETGTRGALLARARPAGGVEREHGVVAPSAVHDVAVDLPGCTSRNDVCERVGAALVGRSGVARVTLNGEVAPDVDFVRAD